MYMFTTVCIICISLSIYPAFQTLAFNPGAV